MRCSLRPSRTRQTVGLAAGLPVAVRSPWRLARRRCGGIRLTRRSPTPTPTPTPHGVADAARADRDQFRSCRPVQQCAQSRQQFPGAARQPGDQRLRPRSRGPIPAGGGASRSDGGAALPDLGRGLRHFGRQTGPQGDFVGDKRKTYGGVAGFGAARRAGRQYRLLRRSEPHRRSTCRWRCSRRRSISPRSASTPPSTRGRGPGPSRWCTASARSIRAATPAFGFATAGYARRIDGALTEISYYWTKDQMPHRAEGRARICARHDGCVPGGRRASIR